MNHRILAALLAATSPVAAQQLPTLFAGGTTVPAGGAVYFNLDCNHPSGITVSSFVLNFADPGGTAGTVDIFVAEPGTAFDVTWTPLVTGINVTSVGPGAPTNVPLGTSSPLQLSNGCSYDVAIVSSLQHLVTPQSTTGQLIYSNADLVMENGAYTDGPFTGATNFDYVVNGVIFYQPGGACPSQATTTTIGQGCVQEFGSVYETFPPGALDLPRITYSTALYAGSTTTNPITFSPSYVAPGSASTSFSTTLSLVDDGQRTLGSVGMQPPFDQITVGSNGWVALGPGNSNSAWPSPDTMLLNPATAFYAWKDLDPTAGGVVTVEQRTVFGSFPQVVVTFEDVPSYGQNDANTIQHVLTFLPSGGPLMSVTTHFPSVATNGSTLLVGRSLGGASADPGSADLSTPKSYAAADRLPLRLDAVAPPRQGAAPIPFELITSNVPASALLHVGVLGFTSGNFALDGLGMPTCSLYVSLDRLVGPQLVTGSSVQWTAWTLPPVQPSYAGAEFYVQSFIMGTDLNDAFGGLGVLTSNGLACTIGTL